MGDLNRGETFAAGETVTHTRLHALVDDATIGNGKVTTAKIADGAVTSAKLAGSLAVSAGNISLASGKLLGGNGSNVGEAVTVGASLSLSASTLGIAAGGVSATELASNAVTTAKITDANVTTAKIADNAVTLAKQASMTDNRLLGRSAGSAGIPQEITVGSGLSLSGGTLSCSVSALSTYSWTPAGTVANLVSGSATTSSSTGLTNAPELVQGWIICSDAGGDAGYSFGDRVEFLATRTTSGVGLHASTSIGSGYPLTITRVAAGAISVPHKTNGTLTAITETKWAFRVYAIKF